MSEEKENALMSLRERALASMLKTTESLFFSMPIPEEVASKYNYLKESKFRLAGLEFVPITKAQFPLIGSSAKQSPAAVETVGLCLLENTLGLCSSLLEHFVSIAKDVSGKEEGSGVAKGREISEYKAKISRILKDIAERSSVAAKNERFCGPSGKPIGELQSQFMKTVDNLTSKYMESMEKTRESMEKQNETIRMLRSENVLLASNARLKESNTTAQVDRVRKQLEETHAAEKAELAAAADKAKLRVAELEKVVAKINEKLKEFYEENKSPKDRGEADGLTYVEFIVGHAEKLANDNRWLVEKLAEFGKENEEFKKSCVVREQCKTEVKAKERSVQLSNEMKNAKVLVESFSRSYNELAVYRIRDNCIQNEVAQEIDKTSAPNKQ